MFIPFLALMKPWIKHKRKDWMDQFVHWEIIRPTQITLQVLFELRKVFFYIWVWLRIFMRSSTGYRYVNKNLGVYNSTNDGIKINALYNPRHSYIFECCHWSSIALPLLFLSLLLPPSKHCGQLNQPLLQLEIMPWYRMPWFVHPGPIMEMIMHIDVPYLSNDISKIRVRAA